MKIEYENLEKNFTNRKNERDIDPYHEQGASVNVYFVKTSIKDLTDFLLCVLRKNCKEITLDDEEYLIECKFLDKAHSAVVGIIIT